jgi:acyl-CoA reductase-like NAD-dependent aldehyde dehydrogenase
MEASSSSGTGKRKRAADSSGNGQAPAKPKRSSAAKPPSSASKRKTAKPKPKPALESFNPATGELLGTVETITPGTVQSVVDDVAEVQPFWAQLSLEDRARYMRRACDVLLDEIDELAELLSREQGKPRVECYTMELLPTADALKWIADAGPDIIGDERLSMPQAFLKTKRSKFVYEPIGVVGVIAPWNYPWSIPFGEVAIALMAGNGVVLKPASLTPLIGERIRTLFEKAGFPEGLVRTVHGGGKIGDALVKSSAGKIFFTGSVPVGYKVGVEAAKRMKGSVLELGGKDPQIVCADADLANAISGAVWGGFANAGQTCSGIERVYVHRDVAERFIEGVVRETERLTVGDPLEWTTEIGPMVSEEQAGLVTELVDDALEHGAERLTGGPTKVKGTSSSKAMKGSFIAPTVLTGVTHEMRIMKEEIFGPVLPIVTVDSEEEAVRLANDSDFGLGASVWTTDRAKGERMARRIQSGMVWVNDHSFSHGACQCAWGGVKDSGLGRSHSKFGFYECVNVKLVTWEPGWTRDFWWQPYDQDLGQAIRSSALLLYGRNGKRLDALREGAGALVRVGRKTLQKGK